MYDLGCAPENSTPTVKAPDYHTEGPCAKMIRFKAGKDCSLPAEQECHLMGSST